MLAALVCAVFAPQDPSRLPPVVVEADPGLLGVADSASEGSAGRAELERYALLRPAQVLEVVPGLAVTQHSGGGKSNQLFVRGFNLDHGTDLATSLFGVPMNLPSHGHGQGYTDLNPLIPELVGDVRWRLGPYDVRDGDFASAGAVDIDYVRRLDRGLATVTGGSYGYRRSLVADSFAVGGGDLLLGVELQTNDGRFDVDQDHDKRNAYLSWSTDTLRFAAFAHTADWTSTDQIPARAVQSGMLSRFGSLDPSDGGRTDWYGLASQWRPELADGVAEVAAYAFLYELDLWSNFTYALDDPIAGDQFEQRDARSTFGMSASRTWRLHGLASEATVGAELRRDRIHNGLHRSRARTRLDTLRTDAITQSSVAAFGELRFEPAPWLRARAGVRGDHYEFEVDAERDVDSGRERDGIVGGKAGVTFGPWAETEFHVNFGTGFHSNDARGVLLGDDPATPDPADGTTVPGLVRSRGVEVGVRSELVPGLRTTLASWALELDSELVFVGDAGTSEPSRASRRLGVEWANEWRPLPWLVVDADVTAARARFRGSDPAGEHVPGAVPLTLVGGIAVDCTDDLHTGLRVRHLGRRPLLEDGSVRSSSSTLVDLSTRWQIDDHRELGLELLNLLDRDDSDIEYFYASRLPGEAAAVDDVHFHPVEPFTLRLSFTARF